MKRGRGRGLERVSESNDVVCNIFQELIFKGMKFDVPCDCRKITVRSKVNDQVCVAFSVRPKLNEMMHRRGRLRCLCSHVLLMVIWTVMIVLTAGTLSTCTIQCMCC